MPWNYISAALKILVLGCAFWLLWHYRREVIPTISHEAELEAQEGNETEVAVDLGRVKVGTVQEYLIATGRVEPAPAAAGKPAGGAAVASPVAGVVATISVGEGDLVAKDQPLFSLDARLADAAADKAKQSVAADEQELSRVKSAADSPLWRIAQLEALRRTDELSLRFAEQQKQLLTIRAPLAGTVVQMLIHPGETASPTTPAIQIVDLNRLVLSVGVAPDRLPELRIGQAAFIGSTPAGTTRPAGVSEVSRIDPIIDPATGLGLADVPIPPGINLRPGGFATVQIVIRRHENVLVVPLESLTRDSSDRPCIPVTVRNDRWAELTPVTVGLRDQTQVEISGSGVSAGTEIATSGVFAIGDKTAIRPNPVRH